jgi:hypothetical protein
MTTSTLLMSHTLAAAVYDDSQQRLQLDFRDGSRYIYFRVSQDLFHGFLAATSKGRFFNQHIRRVLPYSKAAPNRK